MQHQLLLKAILSQYDARVATTKLAPYLTTKRQERIELLLPKRLGFLHIAVESPSNPHNAAAVVRTCEALGVINVHVINVQDKILHAKNTTQGAFHWVNTYHHASLSAFLNGLTAIIPPEQTITLAGAANDGTTALTDVAIDQPLCLLFGNEKNGLSARARAACHLLYHIPMVGMSESLNLSVAAAISLYDIVSRKRQQLGKPGDLSTKQQALLRLQYYLHSLERRLIINVLQLKRLDLH